MQDIFQFEIDHLTAERQVAGSLRPTGLRPSFLSKFQKHGIDLPIEMFQIPGGHLAAAGGHVAKASR